ncbi:MAG: cell wall hydrolase [Oscillospiraceae bacterium]|nr:cell wall hydrolase [Oscillospiraceae bacterium]
MRKIAKLCTALLAIALILPFGRAAAAGGVEIYIDNERAFISDSAFIESGTTYVKAPDACRQLGAEISQADAQTLTASAPGLSLNINAKKTVMNANGRYLWLADRIFEKDGVMYVPLRTLCDVFGAQIEWDGATRSIHIITGGEPIMPGSEFYNADDLYWLSRIIEAEAGGEKLIGQIAVGNVVINRVVSSEFPDTIYGVIFDKKYGVQFTPAYSGAVYNTPSENAVIAACLAMEGTNIVDNSLYFVTVKVAPYSWAGRNCEFVTQLGCHNFYV